MGYLKCTEEEKNQVVPKSKFAHPGFVTGDQNPLCHHLGVQRLLASLCGRLTHTLKLYMKLVKLSVNIFTGLLLDSYLLFLSASSNCCSMCPNVYCANIQLHDKINLTSKGLLSLMKFASKLVLQILAKPS